MRNGISEKNSVRAGRLPSWFRQEIPEAKRLQSMRARLRAGQLHTVCESARCPNSSQCWGAGVVLFAGSLYWLALGGPRWLGPVTPLGGVAFIAGWLLVARAAFSPKPAG